MIYFNLVIPILAIILCSILFPKRLTIWERALMLAVPAIVILLAKVVSVTSQTTDTEIWNSYITKAKYEEAWNEWVVKQCCADRDKDGNCTSHKDCSECEHHAASWTLYDNLGVSYSSSESEYLNVGRSWNTEEIKTERGRRCECDCWGSGEDKDNDTYYYKASEEFDKTIPVVRKKTYENRVKCSKSVFNFMDLDTSEIRAYGLYEYPSVNYIALSANTGYNPIIGWSDQKTSDRLQRFNARMGGFKQVHMLILVFPNQPQMAALKQEAYWKRGNKNEFILCLGAKGKEITWAYVISWTEVEKLKQQAAQEAKNFKTLDSLSGIVDMIASKVKTQFIRKQFKDFSYLSVEPTTTAVLVTFILTILTTIGISLFAILNRYEA